MKWIVSIGKWVDVRVYMAETMQEAYALITSNCTLNKKP